MHSYVPLKGKGLTEARGQNPNKFFISPGISKPMINNDLKPSSLNLRKIYEYDISTQKGDIIEITKT